MPADSSLQTRTANWLWFQPGSTTPDLRRSRPRRLWPCLPPAVSQRLAWRRSLTCLRVDRPFRSVVSIMASAAVVLLATGCVGSRATQRCASRDSVTVCLTRSHRTDVATTVSGVAPRSAISWTDSLGGGNSGEADQRGDFPLTGASAGYHDVSGRITVTFSVQSPTGRPEVLTVST